MGRESIGRSPPMLSACACRWAWTWRPSRSVHRLTRAWRAWGGKVSHSWESAGKGSMGTRDGGITDLLLRRGTVAQCSYYEHQCAHAREAPQHGPSKLRSHRGGTGRGTGGPACWNQLGGPGGEAYDEMGLALLVQATHDRNNLATQGVMWCRDRDRLAVSPIPSRSVLAEVPAATSTAASS
jgi:hypothetical protein